MRVRMMRRAVLILIGLALVAPACGGDDEGTGGGGGSGGGGGESSSQELEDGLVFAGPGGAIGEVYKSELEAFGEEHDIDVTYVEGTSASGFARIQAEAQAGRREIDMLQSNDQTLALGAGQDLWEPLDVDQLPNADQLVTEMAFPDDLVGDPPVGVRLILNTVGLVYNTEIFEEKGWDPPTSWEDMYDPEYAECTIPLGPESGVPYLPLLNEINSGDYGDISGTIEEFKAVRGDIPVWSDSNPDALELLAQGVGCLTPSTQGRAIAPAAGGAPIAFVDPEEGTPFFGGPVTITRDAPHVNAAHAFMNELMSAEFGQRMLEEGGFATANSEVERATSGPNAELPVASEIETLNLVDVPISAFDQVDTWVQEWTRLASGS